MDKKKKNILIVVIILLLILILLYFLLFANKKYEITMDANGGKISQTTEKVSAGTKIGDLDKPTKDGYVFLYWMSENKKLDDSYEINSDMKLIAIWDVDKPKYSISFSTDGGSNVTTQEIVEGSTITKPADPTKDGYKFKYWAVDGKECDFSQPVTGPITLTAVWEKAKQFTVTFNSNGGSKVETQKVFDGSLVTKPSDPTKDGYVLSSWQLNGKDFDFSTPVTKDITLKAKWEEDDGIVKYTVTFNSDGGSNVASQRVKENSKVAKPTNPTKSGYAFVSWQLDGTDYNFSSSVTKDITLKATWKKLKTFTVSFDSDGGSNVASKSVTENSKVAKPTNPTKSGYIFVAWQLDGKNYDFASKVTKDMTLVATWREAKEYSVSFNLNGGSGNATTQTIVEGNKAKKPADPTRAGYKFSGWDWDFSKTVTKDITVNAKWTQKKYVIKIAMVDSYSPDRKLAVYEDGKLISVAGFRSSTTGSTFGGSMVINVNELSSISYVVLSDGKTVVSATKEVVS